LQLLFPSSQGDHQDIDTVDSSTDSTWLNNTNNNTINNNITNNTSITDLQPRPGPTATTTEAADSYFDFDIESPGSPIDECEYTRLIETSVTTPQEPQAPESGFVCASPCSTLEGGSASSSDANFFDPESSDTGTEFFDCATEPKPPRRYHHLSHNRVSIRPPSPIVASPSSSESSATPTSKMNGHVRLVESSACDSSDSFPPSQSTNSSISNASKLNSNSNSNSTLQDAEGEMAVDEVADEGELKGYWHDFEKKNHKVRVFEIF
jgi:protein phosphatase 1 regulatory subunit 3A/B/C/D/E